MNRERERMNRLYPCSAVCGGAPEETVGALILQAKTLSERARCYGPPFPHEVRLVDHDTR